MILASLLAKDEARRPGGRRRETVLRGKVQNAKTNERGRSVHGRTWGVWRQNDRQFRCCESGIPAAAQLKGRRVTEPPYELRSAVTGVEQREVGRWIGSKT